MKGTRNAVDLGEVRMDQPDVSGEAVLPQDLERAPVSLVGSDDAPMIATERPEEPVEVVGH